MTSTTPKICCGIFVATREILNTVIIFVHIYEFWLRQTARATNAACDYRKQNSYRVN